MEESLTQARSAYERITRYSRDLHKTLEADLKKQLEDLRKDQEDNMSCLQLEIASLNWKFDEFSVVKAWDECWGSRRLLHAWQKKTPFGEVPLLTKDVEKQLDAAISHFDNLQFPLVDSLVALPYEPLPLIQEALSFMQETPKEGEGA
ncbi:hypothetical protein Hanom_Chr17g01570461 [Helianthus anomalus]